jgi:hypothetical protein
MFTLTNEQPLPDPQPGQCGSAHRLLGWDTPIGGAYLYDSINTAFQYGRGLCSRALADEMCAGVGFLGQNNYYDSLNRPWEEIIDPYVYLEGNDHSVCEPATSTLVRSGNCCDASWTLGLSCAELFPAVRVLEGTMNRDQMRRGIEAARAAGFLPEGEGFNPDGPMDVAYINHYHNKTKEDWELRCKRGRVDCDLGHDYNRWDEEININNQVEDLSAYNFLYGN